MAITPRGAPYGRRDYFTVPGVEVQAGDLIVAFGCIAASALDTTFGYDNAAGGSNVYREVDLGVFYPSPVSAALHVFYAIAKASETLTVGFNGTAGSKGIVVAVGYGNIQDLDQVLGAYLFDVAESASSLTHQSASITASAGSTVFACWGHNYNSSSILAENGTGFTEALELAAGGYPMMALYRKDDVAAGSQQDNVTSSTSIRLGNIVVEFKAAAAGVSGSGGTTQPVQTISGAGTLPINGSGATSQPVQAISGAGTVGAPSGVTGSGSTTQPVQTIAGYGNTQAPAQGVPLVQAAMNGLFDGARVKLERVFMPTWGDTSPGSVVLFEGNVAACEPSSTAVKLTIKSELERLNVALPKYLYQPSCGHVLYGAGCGISKAAWTVTGTVGSGATTTNLPSGRSEATGYFNLGVLVMTSGAALGARRSVRAFSGGAFTLALPLPVAPAPGDTFQVYPGCDHSLGASGCARFSNQNRYRGFPNVPRPEAAR